MKAISTLALAGMSIVAFGQSAEHSSGTRTGFVLDINTILLLLAVFLLVPVLALSRTFTAAAKQYYRERMKKGTVKIWLLLALTPLSSSLLAKASGISGRPGLTANGMTILLLCVIAVELLLLFYLAAKTNDLIQKKIAKAITTGAVEKTGFLSRLETLWASMNFRPAEEEHALDTGHDYDGIRELDNVIPPWFTAAFAITILFGIGYIYRYHIAKSAPMQIEEYENAIALAALQHEEYLGRQTASINESNVALMEGADLAAGENVFNTLCAICHKKDGGGLVGPNLTDDYWIHGGSLQDIFKTVKYGVPDKGMISWKEQLSPMQMAQVSNYILTLRGTNPPDAKERQGELYSPEAQPAAPGADADTTVTR